jgi:GNAT superfamily N-acetyltransferase
MVQGLCKFEPRQADGQPDEDRTASQGGPERQAEAPDRMAHVHGEMVRPACKSERRRLQELRKTLRDWPVLDGLRGAAHTERVSELPVRVATRADREAVTTTIAVAFFTDPVWSFVFPDDSRRLGQLHRWWGFYVDQGLQHNWVRVTEGCESAAVWFPPGVPEVPPEDEQLVLDLLRDLVGDDYDRVMKCVDCFDESHPAGDEHFYLSLVGTHDDYRGSGFGMALLRENVALIDDEGQPAYLESSNPSNHPRYASLGFEPIGEFTLPGGPSVQQMWRDPQ